MPFFRLSYIFFLESQDLQRSLKAYEDEIKVFFPDKI